MRLLRNPLAQKRWQRFKRRRRAFVSLLAMLSLCVLGLLANVICNDRPLYVRFDGHHYFPAFRNYADTEFTGSGLHTRPNYRTLSRSPAFAGASGNMMFFAPIPYGPRESLDPTELAHEETISLRLAAAPHVASVNVDRELRIERATAAGHFFGVPDADVAGLTLDDHWRVSDALRIAIEQRLGNEATDAHEETLIGMSDTAQRADIQLPPFSPRASAPTAVRLRLSEPVPPGVENVRIVFGRDGTPHPAAADFLGGLGEDARSALLGLVNAQADSGVSFPVFVEASAIRYRAEAETNVVRWPYRPVRGHWMGIDAAGHDVLARVLYGLRISLAFGFLLVLAAMLAGGAIGAVQGYFGGTVDITGQRLIEVWSALPFLYIMILMGSVFGRSFGLLLFCYGLFNWIGISYYVRAEFLRLRHEPFVESAKCLGIPARKIMWRHVMPNALTPLITFFPFLLVGAISALAALDFLGFGLPPLTPSWGELLRQAQQHRGAWWLILYPALALFTVMILGVFIGEGVRDAYDPRPQMRLE